MTYSELALLKQQAKRLGDKLDERWEAAETAEDRMKLFKPSEKLEAMEAKIKEVQAEFDAADDEAEIDRLKKKYPHPDDLGHDSESLAKLATEAHQNQMAEIEMAINREEAEAHLDALTAVEKELVEEAELAGLNEAVKEALESEKAKAREIIETGRKPREKKEKAPVEPPNTDFEVDGKVAFLNAKKVRVEGTVRALGKRDALLEYADGTTQRIWYKFLEKAE